MAKTNKQVHDEKVEAINTLLQAIEVIAKEFEIQNGGTVKGLVTGLTLSINSTKFDNIKEARITRSDGYHYWSIKYHPESFTILDTNEFTEEGKSVNGGQLFLNTNGNYLTAAQDAASELNKVKNWIHS